MFSNINKDYAFGTNSECMLLPTLQNLFGSDLECSTDKFATIDFSSNTHNVELKTRRNTMRKYPTTMIGKNKIDYLVNSEKKGIVVFKFTDGLYYLEITRDNINKFGLEEGGRSDRGYDERQLYYFIPTNMLKLIS